MRTILYSNLAILFALIAILCVGKLNLDDKKEKEKQFSQTDQDYFSAAQKQIAAEKKQDIYDAAKKVIRDSEAYLIDIPTEDLRTVTESDLECIRMARDIVLDSDVEIPAFFESDIDYLITHIENAIGNDSLSFNRKDLLTLRELIAILEKNAQTIQSNGSEPYLHLLEYKIATRIK